MDTLNDMYEFVGKKIKFKAGSDEYEGVVKHVNKKFSRIIVNRAFLLPEMKFMGTLHFYDYEIESYDLLSDDQVLDTTPEDFLRKYVKKSKKYTDSYAYYSDSDCASQCTENLENIEKHEEKYVFVPPETFQNLLPTEVSMLHIIDEEFVQAVEYLYKETMIAVTFEGPKIKRSGIITWICISTPLKTFLFDIQALKKTCFDKGLRNIFEDASIEKIIHDSRRPADCLFHMFSTKLVNVFDTQVADYILHYQRNDNFKRCVRTINSCLEEYLKIPQMFLHEAPVHNSFQSLVNFYNIRPLSDKFQDYMVKNVIYLRALKKEIFPLLMLPFFSATAIYSSSVSYCTDKELLLEPSTPNKIPFQLQVEGLCMLRLKTKCQVPPVASSGDVCQNLDSVKILDKYINLSKKLCKRSPKTDVDQLGTPESDISLNLCERAFCKFKTDEESDENSETDDSDPWIKMRNLFLPHCDQEYKKKYDFIPA